MLVHWATLKLTGSPGHSALAALLASVSHIPCLVMTLGFSKQQSDWTTLGMYGWHQGSISGLHSCKAGVFCHWTVFWAPERFLWGGVVHFRGNTQGRAYYCLNYCWWWVPNGMWRIGPRLTTCKQGVGYPLCYLSSPWIPWYCLVLVFVSHLVVFNAYSWLYTQ